MAFIQELILKFTHEFFMHHPSIPEDDKTPKEVEANARLDSFMETIVRGMSELKPLSVSMGHNSTKTVERHYFHQSVRTLKTIKQAI